MNTSVHTERQTFSQSPVAVTAGSPQRTTGRRLLMFVLFGLSAFAGVSRTACALDYRSIAPSAAIFYDAPSEKGRRISIAPHGMPVEVVLMYGNWVKVRDASGDLSWVKKEDLVDARTVVVSANPAEIRSGAMETNPVVFRAARGVVLQVVQPAQSGWLKVRHIDGDEGYVRLSDVWGGAR